LDLINAVINAIMGGLYALEDYVAYHVLTCLVPAFLLAGAITVFISREAILRYLGSTSRKAVSFPLAAASSMGLAVCSCTVIPIAAGLYRRGSSIGPAFIILWTAPASSLLALVYTGAILGMDMALARIVAALSTAVVVGLVMTTAFRREEAERASRLAKSSSSGGSSGEGGERTTIIGLRGFVLIILLIATLLIPNYLGVGRPYFPDKVVLFLVPMAVTSIYAWRAFEGASIKEWLRETLWFVRLIFLLMLIGVFVVGIIKALLPEEWVHAWLGGNALFPTFLATLIGAVTYFATLTEAPFVHALMTLGMGPAPALGLLLAGPGLSAPNMIAIARVFGAKKAVVYILTTVALATVTAYILGNMIWS
jgi:uncharacterized membrane protein YraQ (UPF0718 family)